MPGHVAEIVGHDPEKAGHVRPKYAAMIANARKDGPFHRLCRSIRDARESDYEALVGIDFGAQ